MTKYYILDVLNPSGLLATLKEQGKGLTAEQVIKICDDSESKLRSFRAWEIENEDYGPFEVKQYLDLCCAYSTNANAYYQVFEVNQTYKCSIIEAMLFFLDRASDKYFYDDDDGQKLLSKDISSMLNVVNALKRNPQTK
jgi:hypothetical protein